MAKRTAKPRTDVRESETPAQLDRADDRTHSSSMGSEPSEEDIRMRAYQRFVERGRVHGGHFEDWIDAEQELKKSDR
jgi:Protein of unknown function (DUF2934)